MARKKRKTLADKLIADAAKPPRKQRTRADAPGAKALQSAPPTPGVPPPQWQLPPHKRAGASGPGPGHNSGRKKPAPLERSERDVREGFLQHLRAVNLIEARLAAIKKQLADAYAAAKADGYRKRQFQLARDFENVKGEAKITAHVGDVLQVARWIGHPMGAQLDLFHDTPDRADHYEEGKLASMRNQPCKPGHDPGTQAYEAWMKGYDDHQRQLAGGFKAPA